MNKSHKQQMKQLKTEMSGKIKSADKDKGLILVLTGEGKGKSTSGFGMVLRSLGHKKKVAVVQFIKGKWKTGEAEFCKEHSLVNYYAVGAGFTWDTQDKEHDTELVRKTWDKACEFMKDEEVHLVLLDEINVAMHFGYLEPEVVKKVLENKRDSLHVICTGRDAPKSIIEMADTVSEVVSIKHAFDNGIRAQVGIEF